MHPMIKDTKILQIYMSTDLIIKKNIEISYYKYKLSTEFYLRWKWSFSAPNTDSLHARLHNHRHINLYKPTNL